MVAVGVLVVAFAGIAVGVFLAGGQRPTVLPLVGAFIAEVFAVMAVARLPHVALAAQMVATLEGRVAVRAVVVAWQTSAPAAFYDFEETPR